MKDLEYYFDQIMQYMINNRITDLHIDPQKQSIIFRKHKLLINKFNHELISNLYRFLKYKSNINLESFGSLDTGRFEYRSFDQVYYLRFAVLENFNREHGVLRIINVNPIDTLSDCGLSETEIKKILKMYHKGHGLILFCGKTGAGKSTTMFSSFNHFKEKEIFSLENPIEKIVDHLIQIESTSNELDEHISQLLRHDPDILVIGEIRSSDELQSAIRASLTGHLLVSTLHAGNTDEVVHRLNDLKISSFDLRNIIKGIIFQSIEFDGEKVDIKFEILEEESIKGLIN